MSKGVIVGSGLLARAFAAHANDLTNTCIYAAGVSNSSCIDNLEFERDTNRLSASLAQASPRELFIYFSTCSISDPYSQDSRYVTHKKKLEELVRAHSRHSIIRLPQVAGKTPNPHTILNYLYNRIARSERFDLWRNAKRNIIDVEDVAKVVLDLVTVEDIQSETINLANPRSYSMQEIISALEKTARHRAIYNVVDKGGDYFIDTSRIAASVKRTGIAFDDGYLLRTLSKYYV